MMKLFKRFLTRSKFRSIQAPHLTKTKDYTPMTLAHSVQNALDTSLSLNPLSFLIGEDIGFGGMFRCTSGLLQKYGSQRVLDMPLTEQGIIGFAIGLAASGCISIAEIQVADYIFPAFDQIVNEAAKYRYRSGGMFNCAGLTIRAPYGAFGGGGLYHSQSPEAFFAHIPGIKVVIPRGPIQAKGLLLSCIFDPNPCIFFEPKAFYKTAIENVPDEDFRIELSKGEVIQKGKDMTLIGYGSQTFALLDAAHMAKEQLNISCEIIDLQTISPWDEALVYESVSKTGHVIVSHEAPLTGGFASEVAASIQENCYDSLKSAVTRVCGHDAHITHSHETLVLPDKYRLFEEIKRIGERK
uniref:3-methyl-2-oxobutanoate dehydrogenase (2-methylpropanoyl-transferring) n=1 Tax=Myxobolus squamalis TaxID=59785 RepID=A0A6B2FZZ8_MYXSQ